MPVKPSILLLSAYDAASHRHWRNWITSTFAEYEWTTIALPDRHFYWRVRSNALTYVSEHRSVLEKHFDLIVMTSMVDLATLRGLMPALAQIPAVVYFHENQFAYPVNTDHPHKSNIINAQLNSVFTALVADRLLFNSCYNCQTFFEGSEALFRKMPDGVKPDILDPLKERSEVLAVPVIGKPPGRKDPTASTLQIVWNHRWEYDKQPEVFFACMYRLSEQGVPFRLHVLGQSFRSVPDCFADAKNRLARHIESWGFQTEADYHRILDHSDIVVSTAVHDFQGLSMLEAIHRGCVPVAPDRVAYPEYIPANLLYDSSNEVESLTALLHELITVGLPSVPDVAKYTDAELKAPYKQMLQHAIEKSLSS